MHSSVQRRVDDMTNLFPQRGNAQQYQKQQDIVSFPSVAVYYGNLSPFHVRDIAVSSIDQYLSLIDDHSTPEIKITPIVNSPTYKVIIHDNDLVIEGRARMMVMCLSKSYNSFGYKIERSSSTPSKLKIKLRVTTLDDYILIKFTKVFFAALAVVLSFALITFLMYEVKLTLV